MSDLLPGLNTLVQIYLPGEEVGLASRVEGVGADYLEFPAPSLPATTHLELGQEMDLFWRDKRGMHKVPTRLVDNFITGHRIWRVEPIGIAEKFQRRRFTRAGVMLDVEINFLKRKTPIKVQVRAIDMSEGGVRCRTNQRLALVSGEEVELTLELSGVTWVVAGLILRKDHIQGQDRATALDEFVVLLKEPVLEPVAHAFRKEVFRAQRQQRRTERAMDLR